MDEAVDCRDGHGLVREYLVPATEGLIGRDGKLSRLRDWIAARMTAKPDLTLDDLVLEIADEHQVTVHRVSVWRTLHGLGLTHKKRPASC